MDKIPFTLTDVDFLQDELNFSSIDPTDFERLVFHLLDEMGFSNLVWRKGGEGNSATDGGRDLEATYWTHLPTGSKEEKYWIEVKFRKNQLEKSQVQRTLLNAAGDESSDNIIIATNSTVSNPSLDWVKEFQKKHKTPNSMIWQGHDLELLLRKNLRTLAMFLPSSLSFSGKCKVIESRFWNLLLLPVGPELEELWVRREEFTENSLLTLIAVVAEVAYGDVTKRPWGLILNDTRLLSVAVSGMLSAYPIIFKSLDLNRDQSPVIKGLSYLLQCVLLKYGEELTAKVLFNPEELSESAIQLPNKAKVSRSEPIIGTIYDQLSVHCSENYCSKVSHIGSAEKTDYFSRFTYRHTEEVEADDQILILNSSKSECQIGLVKPDKYCPLGEAIKAPKSESALRKKLKFARSVLLKRTAKYEEYLE